MCCCLLESDMLNESFVVDEHIVTSGDDDEVSNGEEHWEY